MKMTSALRLAFPAAAFVALLAAPAAAQTETDDSYWQCATLGVGPAVVNTDGSEYSFKYNGALLGAEAGYGFCGPHTEFGVRARFGANSELLLAAPALLLRLHTETPAQKGVEGGVGVRLGANFLHASNFPWSDDRTFDGSGVFAALGPDLRYWFDRHWAFTGGLDFAVGSAGEQSVYAMNLSFGAVAKW